MPELIRYRFEGGDWRVTSYTHERLLGLILGGAETVVIPSLQEETK